MLVESHVGKGSRFTIHLPLTLAIVRAVLVEAGAALMFCRWAIGENTALRNVRGETSRRRLGGRGVISLHARTTPLVDLSGLLGDPEAARSARVAGDAYAGDAYAGDAYVVVGIGDRQIGLCMDALVGEQEVVIKSRGTLLGDTPGLCGATILGDGEAAPIVDVAKAVQRVQSEDRGERGDRRHAAPVRPP